MPTLWDRVDRLIDRSPGLADLRTHRLQLLAARRWRSLGRPVPPDLLDEERDAAFIALATPAVLNEVRAACEGPIVLIKGPEVAARYPDPVLRPYNDLDLLVQDADAAQRALMAAGFEPVGDPRLFVGIHHLRPLHSPLFPLYVEIHSQPKWPERIGPPSIDELMSQARPASVGVNGILAPSPSHHALLAAAHWWAHEPLSRLIGVLDVAALVDGHDRVELDSLAQAWGLGRLWRTTMTVADALLLGEDEYPWALRLWAGHLPDAREQTVLESHLRRSLAPFWALPLSAATGALGASIAKTFRPEPGESWRQKLRRTRGAFRHAFAARSEHERGLAR
jgi:hypothetical protein